MLLNFSNCKIFCDKTLFGVGGGGGGGLMTILCHEQPHVKVEMIWDVGADINNQAIGRWSIVKLVTHFFMLAPFFNVGGF